MAQRETMDHLVTADGLVELLTEQADVRILDVRTPAEFESAHIPGSYNVPLELLPEHAAAIGAVVGGPVVLVCRSGARARQAQQALRSAALPRLRILDGGLADWEQRGLPLMRGRQRWSLERQVRGVAGGIVLVSALAGVLIAEPLALIAAGIGGGLLFSALTNTCGLAALLAKLPYNRGASCDIGAVVDALKSKTTPAATGD